MTSTGAGTRRDVTLKLPQLQNLCKRDPPSYREDYDAQVRRLRSECAILALSPSADPSPSLVELIQFAAAVSSSSYKGEESDRVAALLIDLLLGQCSGATDTTTASSDSRKQQHQLSGDITMSVPPSALQLHRDVRKACVSALILMRNKGAVPPLDLLELFFRVMSSVPDKNLREILHRHIVNDVRNVNKKGKRDDKVNRAIQTFLHRIVSSPSLASASDADGAGDVASRRAVDMVAELYRRGVWTDERTVAIMASAVESPNPSVMAKAMRFFLGIEEKMAQDKAREEDDEWSGVNQIDLHLHSKKTSKKKRRVTKQVKNRKKAQIRRESEEAAYHGEDRGVEASRKLYPAIELLNDPQGLAESTFARCRRAGSNSYKFEVKLLMINFVTRIVGNHELLLLPLYPFLQRYMGGHQRDVTAILAYAVQSCHQYVPPEEVHGILKTIAHNFITERCSGEQMAVGINAVRAICARVPSVLAVEDEIASLDEASGGGVSMDVEAFVRDLAAYSRHRDRSVSIAGKGWTNFIREVHPSLLQGKDRGEGGSALHRAGVKPLRYGERRVAAGVEGADLLVEYEAQKAASKNRGQNGDEEGDSSDEEGDGIQVEKWNDVQDGSPGGESGDDVEKEGQDDAAPNLVLVSEDGKEVIPQESDEIVVSKMSQEERDELRQEVSSNRVFSTQDFVKMRKLVEREERAKRDPRAAAKLKRAIAKGKQFEALSDDSDSDVDSDDGIHIKGAVNPEDIMAEAKRKRMSKAERLEKIIAGRTAFESKARDGGSTNEEKKRKKNFLMTKFAFGTRQKMGGKQTFRDLKANKNKKGQMGHAAKKRRRKM
mmetsp:Transcript_25107/g.54789  ORF Transcript_25107/g.54789 Transcript_25107/m.54789 type:complete len:831 (-) Transcript_25107:120-2612(-)